MEGRTQRWKETTNGGEEGTTGTGDGLKKWGWELPKTFQPHAIRLSGSSHPHFFNPSLASPAYASRLRSPIRRLLPFVGSPISFVLHFIRAANGGEDEDLAVAHTSRASHVDQFADDFIDARIIDPKRDFDFGDEGQRVLAFGILVQITLLLAVALDLTDRTCLERRTSKAFKDPFDQERFYDGDDLFHGRS